MPREAGQNLNELSGPERKYSDSGISRGQWVYEKLIRDVQDGKYAGGVRIREEEIARALGVSRTPVREALSRLQARGLLELAPFGLVVTELSRQQVLELYAVREILEGSAARFAAQHASASEISALHSIAREFDKEYGDPQRLAHLNRQLHGSIYEAAHNRYLMRSLNEFQDTLALLASTTFTVSGRPKEASKEHAIIIKAIERRDADAAEQAARQHIHRAQEARLKMMLGIDG